MFKTTTGYYPFSFTTRLSPFTPHPQTIHLEQYSISSLGGVGGTVASKSALISAGILQSRVRVPPPAPWPDGGPEITLLWTGYTQKKIANHH
ncbi:hypothetical protein PoB_003983200 [Plakobranchus ocellatus]|uniref:Uncharacterized protein n=1 Tax=Plakobranchus ocellatus TaxID=259542 RepID=A0AAV4B1B7_9GAST|nr:hypothetical protein PoB_003983200 [Plakobranchus ocellatus]